MKIPHTKKLTKANIEKARRALERTREHLKRYGSPLDKLTKEEIIQRLRKTRDELWKEKLAARH